jgi:hypothetical protein
VIAAPVARRTQIDSRAWCAITIGVPVRRRSRDREQRRCAPCR